MTKWLWELWKALVGKNFCPGCNSDAAAIDYCEICQCYREPYPPTDETIEIWRQRYRAEAFRRT